MRKIKGKEEHKKGGRKERTDGKIQEIFHFGGGGRLGLKRKPKSNTTLDSEFLGIEHTFGSVIKGRTFKPIFHSQKKIDSATGLGWNQKFLTFIVSWTPLAVW